LKGDRSFKYKTSISDYDTAVKRFQGKDEKKPDFRRVKVPKQLNNYIAIVLSGVGSSGKSSV
jgi:hypothetical protein